MKVVNSTCVGHIYLFYHLYRRGYEKDRQERPMQADDGDVTAFTTTTLVFLTRYNHILGDFLSVKRHELGTYQSPNIQLQKEVYGE